MTKDSQRLTPRQLEMLRELLEADDRATGAPSDLVRVSHGNAIVCRALAKMGLVLIYRNSHRLASGRVVTTSRGGFLVEISDAGRARVIASADAGKHADHR